MKCPSCTCIAPCPCIAPSEGLVHPVELGEVLGVMDEEDDLPPGFPCAYCRTRRCSACGHEFDTVEIGEHLLVDFVKQGVHKAVASALQSIEEATKKVVQAQVVSPKLFSSIIAIPDVFDPSVIAIG
jgi:hypothetical protein